MLRIIFRSLVCLSAALTLSTLLTAGVRAQSKELPKRFLKAVEKRQKVLEKNWREAGEEGKLLMNATSKALRRRDAELVKQYESARRAGAKWRSIIEEELAVLRDLSRPYDSFRGPGRRAVVSVERLVGTEKLLTYSVGAALDRLDKLRGNSQNDEQEKAVQTELSLLNKAWIALEEQRTTLDFVLLNTGQRSVPQMLKLQEDRAAASREYWTRELARKRRDMETGGAVIGGIIMAGAASQALMNPEQMNAVLRLMCKSQWGGVFEVGGDPKEVLGICR